MPEPREESEPKQSYSPPEIVFEARTEVLAAACDGTSNCPSKDTNGSCDVLQTCTSLKS